MRLVPARTVQEMQFPGAPYGVKMACGENPKRVYGRSAVPRPAWATWRATARRSSRPSSTGGEWDNVAARTGRATPPARDLKHETLAGVLRGEIFVQNHCYRADEMAQMLDLAKEFGFTIRVVPPRARGLQDRRPAGARRVAARRSGPTGGASRWRPTTASTRTLALLQQAGARAIIHSDSPDGHPADEPGGGQGVLRRPSAPGSSSPARTRSGGSPPIRPGRSASTS